MPPPSICSSCRRLRPAAMAMDSTARRPVHVWPIGMMVHVAFVGQDGSHPRVVVLFDYVEISLNELLVGGGWHRGIS
ncbi:MAG TPA: hypothetical protein VEF72_01385 [Mycobacterium sp.]|nr:hypothetical protein [Mycobacterium sp.]